MSAAQVNNSAMSFAAAEFSPPEYKQKIRHGPANIEQFDGSLMLRCMRNSEQNI